jgi:ABC-type uncharacterized transport system involved in gliding motility auxiliary subunit
MSPQEQLYSSVRELMDRYEARSSKIKVREVDPDKNLAEAQSIVDEYQISQINVVVFDSDAGRKVVQTADLAEMDYSGMQYGQGPEMTGFKGEQAFTSAILEVTQTRQPKVLFTTGHGEMGLSDPSTRGLAIAQSILQDDNVIVEEWPTLGKAEVPADADLVVIAGPSSNFVEPELLMLRSHLDNGGHMLVALDPVLRDDGGLVEAGLESLLGDFGAEVGNNIVVDPANPLPFFGAETIFVNSYGVHPITRPLSEAQLPVIIPLARSVVAADVDGLTVTELFKTTSEGWGESNLRELDKVEKQEDDLEGPVSLGVAIESSSPSTSDDADDLQFDEEGGPAGSVEGLDEGEDESPGFPADIAEGLRLVVIGDADFLSNGQLQNAPNEALFSNTMNWLVERDSLVAIPPKKPEQVRLSLTKSQLTRLTWLVLGVLPGIVVATGVSIYFRRRR